MVILEPAEPKEKWRRENGVGYCPFPVLVRDTTGGVAIGKACRAKLAHMCARQGAAHTTRMCMRSGVPRKVCRNRSSMGSLSQHRISCRDRNGPL